MIAYEGKEVSSFYTLHKSTVLVKKQNCIYRNL
jgi:hypothetical protein